MGRITDIFLIIAGLIVLFICCWVVDDLYWKNENCRYDNVETNTEYKLELTLITGEKIINTYYLTENASFYIYTQRGSYKLMCSLNEGCRGNTHIKSGIVNYKILN